MSTSTYFIQIGTHYKLRFIRGMFTKSICKFFSDPSDFVELLC